MPQDTIAIILAVIFFIVGLLLIRKFNTVGKEAVLEAEENRAKKLNEAQARIYETMQNFIDKHVIILMMQFAIVNKQLFDKLMVLTQEINSLNEIEKLELKNDFKNLEINVNHLDIHIDQMLIKTKNKRNRLE